MRTTTGFALAVLFAGFLAPAAARAGGPETPAQWGPYGVQLVDEYGNVLPTFQHRGRTYVLGTLGQRYLVRVWNGSWRRAEVVVSVDGRDVIDGRPSAFEKRGYVVEPQSDVTIDGYRLDESSVAAFRFSTVPRSYASRRGDARDVGVIGVAVFPERERRWIPPPPPPPWHPPAPYPGYDEGRGPQARSSAPPPSPDSGVAAAPEQGAPAERNATPAPAAPQAVPPGAIARPEPERPGLGTEFGEEHGSPVTQVPFERASSRPEAVLTLRYDDRDGLLALGIDVDRRRAAYSDAWMRETSDPFRRNGFAEPPPGWRP